MYILSLGIPPLPVPMCDVVKGRKHGTIYPLRTLKKTLSTENDQIVSQSLVPEFMDIFTMLTQVI